MVFIPDSSDIASDQNLENNLLALLDQFEQDKMCSVADDETNLEGFQNADMGIPNKVDVKEYNNVQRSDKLSAFRYYQIHPKVRPNLSYVALIGLAILSSPEKKMRLSDIYRWICKKFPFYKFTDQSWRNSIRHNLSLNECFMKNDKNDSRNKGHFWTVHPANLKDFMQGDFRRRIARLKVRKSAQQSVHLPNQQDNLDTGFVPMTSWNAPLSRLIKLFGLEAVTSKEERLALRSNDLSKEKDTTSHYHDFEGSPTSNNYHVNRQSYSDNEFDCEKIRLSTTQNRSLHNFHLSFCD